MTRLLEKLLPQCKFLFDKLGGIASSSRVSSPGATPISFFPLKKIVGANLMCVNSRSAFDGSTVSSLLGTGQSRTKFPLKSSTFFTVFHLLRPGTGVGVDETGDGTCGGK